MDGPKRENLCDLTKSELADWASLQLVERINPD